MSSSAWRCTNISGSSRPDAIGKGSGCVHSAFRPSVPLTTPRPDQEPPLTYLKDGNTVRGKTGPVVRTILVVIRSTAGSAGLPRLTAGGTVSAARPRDPHPRPDPP